MHDGPIASPRRPELRLVTAPSAPSGAVPPHDLDAEASVLSSLMLDVSHLDRVRDLLPPEAFYSRANRTVYGAIVEVRAAGQEVDIVTVAGWLRDREVLQQIGGASYLAQIADATPAVANVLEHARIVSRKWMLRQTIAQCQRIAAEGYGDVGEELAYVRAAADRLEEIARSAEPSAGVRLRESLTWAMGEVMASADRDRRKLFGYDTGFRELNRLTGGMIGKTVTMLGAETGRGKSAFTGNLSVNVAVEPEVETDERGQEHVVPRGVVIFSLEMPHEQFSLRMACAQGRVDFGRIKAGEWQRDDFARLLAGKDFLDALPIVIDDDPDLTVARLGAKVARVEQEMAAEGVRLALVVVDYAQLMDGADVSERGGNRERELNQIGRRIKRLSRTLMARPKGLAETGIAWLLLTQLTEDGEIRDCRALGQHADNFWIIEHEKDGGAAWDTAAQEAGTRSASILIKKQRQGPRMVRAPLWWHAKYTLFSDEERPT